MSYIWSTLTALARILTLPALRALGGMLSAVLMPVARGAAGVALVIAAVALAHDLGPTTIGRSSEFSPTSVMAHWQQVAPAALKATRTFVTSRMPSWVWSAISAPLTLPTFIFFTFLSGVFGYFGRRRHKVEMFAN